MSEFKGLKILIELREKDDGACTIVISKAGVARKRTVLFGNAIIDCVTKNMPLLSRELGGTCKELYSEAKIQKIPKG